MSDMKHTRIAATVAIVMALSMTSSSADTIVKRSLGLEAARKMVAAAVAEAQRNNWPSTIAVVDESGELLVIERMDEARLAGLSLAAGKARSAAFFRHPTKMLEDTINGGRTAQLTVPDMVQMEGGLPIIADGQVVGAIGVSGETKEHDTLIAQVATNIKP